MGKFRKIGVLTSGGDAPGMNACVRAIARKAAEQGINAVGILGGYSGLIKDEIVSLDNDRISMIIGMGGTIIYTDRCLEFKTEEGMKRAVEVCHKEEIDAIVAIGGDGTFRGATDLTLHGIPTVGIPGTIDNDITATDYTIGFDTAQNTAMHMIDCMRDTSESHARCEVVEIMGNECGELTLKVGIASGAAAIVIPEIKFDEEAAIENIKALRDNGRRGIIVAVSEGVRLADGKKYSELLAKRIAEKTGIETKFAKLAHVQRGGQPSMRDRYTASVMGAKAIDLLLAGKSNVVMCEFDGEFKPVDIRWALAVDRMYKNKLKDGDLDGFGPDEIEAMNKLCTKRRNDVEFLYDLNRQLAQP